MTPETKYPSFHVRLTVVGDELDPDRITQRLHMSPTRACRRGDVVQRPRATVVEKRGRWEVASRLSRERPLAEHIDDVLSVVESSAEGIAALAEEFEVWLLCAVYADRAPELGLTPRQVRAIARLGAAVDMDVYALFSNDAEDGQR